MNLTPRMHSDFLIFLIVLTIIDGSPSRSSLNLVHRCLGLGIAVASPSLELAGEAKPSGPLNVDTRSR